MIDLPDTDMLILYIIREAVPSLGGVGTDIPADMTDHLPFCVARRVAGRAVDPRFLDAPVVDVQTWAGTRKAAYDAAQAVRGALHEAWLNQLVTPYGHITSYREFEAPAELRDRDQLDNIWRFQALYRLGTRH